VYRLLTRARRIERRELRAARRWVERTDTLVHLSVLVFVPLLIWMVTAASNTLDSLSFLLFPPLASGTYTLFADPEGTYASPWQFVAGLTVGALCGWAALVAGATIGFSGGIGVFGVGAFEAAATVFATGALTWALGIEEPAAYATALLALLVPAGQEFTFVVSVSVASTVVAGVFYVWRERFYERRAQFLYESTSGDDHVLVPMRGENPDATAMLAARLAGAHEAGKVVLLDVVDDAAVAAAERDLLETDHRVASDGGSRSDEADPESGDRAGQGHDHAGAEDPVAAAADRLESRAAAVETRVGVPCEVVVAVAGRSAAATVLATARELNCDLVAASYEQQYGALSPFVQSLFRGRTDVLVHRSVAGRTRWKRVLVPVRRASDVAHSMLDFATRLAGKTGYVSVASCVSSDREIRRAETMLANLVEPFDGSFETRVSTRSIERFLTENASGVDLVFLGASRDRSPASRLVSRPTFERIEDLDADVAIVDRH